MDALRVLIDKNSGKGVPNSNSATLDLGQVELEQNAPNPFAAATRITYTLPAAVTGATITIVDTQGRVVKTLANLSGGRQTVELQANSLAAGIYIYTLSVNGKEVASKRMVLTQ